MQAISRKEITDNLTKLIWDRTQKRGVFGCLEVTIGYRGKERVDYMTIDTKDVVRCYEVKSSFEDFNTSHKISFVGHFNYYVMPKNLFERVKEDIPSHVGVYIWDVGYNSVVCEKNPKKQELTINKDILKESMFRSLARENQKRVEGYDEKERKKNKRKISKLEKENKKIYRDYIKYKQALEIIKDKYDISREDIREILRG